MSLHWRNDVFIPHNASNASPAVLCKTLAESVWEEPPTVRYLVQVNGAVHSSHVELLDAGKAACALGEYYPDAEMKIVAVQSKTLPVWQNRKAYR